MGPILHMVGPLAYRDELSAEWVWIMNIRVYLCTSLQRRPSFQFLWCVSWKWATGQDAHPNILIIYVSSSCLKKCSFGCLYFLYFHVKSMFCSLFELSFNFYISKYVEILERCACVYFFAIRGIVDSLVIAVLSANIASCVFSVDIIDENVKQSEAEGTSFWKVRFWFDFLIFLPVTFIVRFSRSSRIILFRYLGNLVGSILCISP